MHTWSTSAFEMRHKGDELFDIAVIDWRVSDIGERLGLLVQDEIDAEGSLVIELFANPHLHLCKVWTLPMGRHVDLTRAFVE
jgi:cytosine/creatinine deaminase